MACATMLPELIRMIQDCPSLDNQVPRCLVCLSKSVEQAPLSHYRDR